MKIHLNQAELFEIAEVGQKQKLQEWLHQNWIQYKFTKKRHIWTTSEQIEKSFFNDEKSGVISFGKAKKTN